MCRKSFILFLFIFFISSVSANEIKSIGKNSKDILYTTISSQKGKPHFPALYLYDTTSEKFLSKKESEAFLVGYSEDSLWSEVMQQWVKDSSHFSATNTSLKQAVPTLDFTQPYIIFFDNLPEPMLAQFAAMDPNLVARDSLVKSILAQLDDANSYTTY